MAFTPIWRFWIATPFCLFVLFTFRVVVVVVAAVRVETGLPRLPSLEGASSKRSLVCMCFCLCFFVLRSVVCLLTHVVSHGNGVVHSCT